MIIFLRSFPSPGFEDFEGEEEKDGRRRDEEDEVAGVDDAFGKIDVAGEDALIDNLSPEADDGGSRAGPPGDDGCDEKYCRRRHRGDDLALGQRGAEQSHGEAEG